MNERGRASDRKRAQSDACCVFPARERARAERERERESEGESERQIERGGGAATRLRDIHRSVRQDSAVPEGEQRELCIVHTELRASF